jgi:hypothetical protein
MPRRCLVLGCALALSACAHHRLAVPEPVPASSQYLAKTTHAFLWGVIEPQRVADECVENSLVDVRVVTSLPHALAATLTLGLWMPARVEYKCGKRTPAEGVIGEPG